MTFGCLIGEQFEKLLSGDRFFFTHKSSGSQNERGLPPRTKESIRKRTLGDIICDNTDAVETTNKVMEISSGNDAKKCSERIGLDFDAILDELQVNQVQVTPVDVHISSSHTCSTGRCGPGKAKYCADDVGTTICHTRHGADNFPWIALEFSAPVQVTKVEILNAQSQWERIGTVDVRITESLPTDGQTMFSDGELFGSFTGPGTTGGVVTLEETPKQGTFVLLQRNKGQHPNEVLIVSDIRVFTSRRVNDEHPSGECAEGWSSYGESCYRFYGPHEQLTWAEAQAECQKQNSNLAIARDENVVLFLGGLQRTNRIWLGAQRQPGSDPAVGWTLIDGSPLSFQNWDQVEPNGEHELCLEQQGQRAFFKWRDHSCDVTNSYICEQQQRSAVTVPIQVAEATSSSLFNNDFLPEYAIDGFPPNQDHRNTNGFHSRPEDYPWFQLKLVSPQTVTGVLILNRIHCCGERLENLEIRAGMTPVDAGFRGKLVANKKVGKFAGPGVTGQTYTIEFDEEVTAQHITLQLTDPNSILQINEIKVFGLARDCPDGWLMYQGQCYGHPKENKLSWADAESYCQSWSAGAHLASIHSAEEQKFVQDNFPQNIWLGGSDASQEGTWVWSDGTSVVYTNWGPGEPNNAAGSQDCIEGNWHDFKWDDDYCTSENLFLCKK